jgi:hypothetical protein
VHAADERVAPSWTDRCGEPIDDVGAGVTRAVDEHLGFASLERRAARDEVDDAADRRHAVQRGRGAFDHLDLSEVHRRDLQQADRTRLTAVQRQAVGQDLCIAPAKALNPDVGAAQRG